MQVNSVYHSDNLEILKTIPNESVDLIYIDPPFNTGKKQKKNDQENGVIHGSMEYSDIHENYLEFIKIRLLEAHRILKDSGSIYFHIDYRESHRCRILLGEIFGEDNFLNEIIWSYDYGGRPKNKWPCKHDTIFLFVKNKKNYYFNQQASDRIPYMSPGLVGAEKTKAGKIPTDVWWHTIVPTQSAENTGYPNQKPLGILKRIVKVSCPKDGLVLDFFAGSGSIGQACLDLGRNFILIDNNPDAIKVMKTRFYQYGDDVKFI